jgi:hypothetical protein
MANDDDNARDDQGDENEERAHLQDELAVYAEKVRRSRESTEQRDLGDDYRAFVRENDPTFEAKFDVERFPRGTEEPVLRWPDEQPVQRRPEARARPGEWVVLAGENLHNVREVYVGGVLASEVLVSGDEMAFQLPEEASAGDIEIVWDVGDRPEEEVETVDLKIVAMRRLGDEPTKK